MHMWGTADDRDGTETDFLKLDFECYSEMHSQ